MENQPFPTLSVISYRSELPDIDVSSFAVLAGARTGHVGKGLYGSWRLASFKVQVVGAASS
jgi:hypothetical protein